MKRSSAFDWVRSPLLQWFVACAAIAFELGYCWGLWRYEHALQAAEAAANPGKVMERVEQLEREEAAKACARST